MNNGLLLAVGVGAVAAAVILTRKKTSQPAPTSIRATINPSDIRYRSPGIPAYEPQPINYIPLRYNPPFTGG